MSMDRSLKTTGALSRHRNVLSRAERIEQLKNEDRWEEGDPVMGLPKVAHRKSHSGRKSAEKTEEVKTEETAEVTEAEVKTE